MAKTKGGSKKAAPSRQSARVARDDGSASDIEVIGEVAVNKSKGKARSAASRSSKRDVKTKNYRDADESDASEPQQLVTSKASSKRSESNNQDGASEKSDSSEPEVPAPSAATNKKKGKKLSDENNKIVEDIDLGEEANQENHKSQNEQEAIPKKETGKKTIVKKGKGKRGPKPGQTPSKKPKREEPETDSDTDREYEVERIVEVKKTKDNQREFLVKWKGFSMNRSTWEPEGNLQHARDLLAAFLNKVEKDDVSRTRRLTTIQSTKSSRGHSRTRSSSVGHSLKPLVRTQEGRVSKSRSRTPRITSTGGSNLLSVVEEEKSSSTKRNGNLSLQQFMQESVERKLEIIKAQHRPITSVAIHEEETDQEEQVVHMSEKTVKTTKQDRSKRKSNSKQPTPSTHNVIKSSRFSRWNRTRTSLACGAVISLGAAVALVFTSPETLYWNHVAPQVQQVIRNLQHTYHQYRPF